MECFSGAGASLLPAGLAVGAGSALREEAPVAAWVLAA